MLNLSHDDNETSAATEIVPTIEHTSVESKERIQNIMGCVSIADRRTCFHMIAQSQLIAGDRAWFYLLRSFAIVCDHDRRTTDDRRSVFPYDRRPFCDLRSAIVCDHMETRLNGVKIIPHVCGEE